MDETNPSRVQHAAITAILENAVDAIITINAQGAIASANPATEKIFGYSVDELNGASISKLICSPRNWLPASDQEDFGLGHEVVGERKDGTVFPMHLAVSEIQIDGKKYFTGIVRDLSDVSERQARLEAILNNAVDAIITIDQDGLVESVNPATEDLFGFEAKELIGENVKILMPSPYREAHDQYLKNYLDTGNRKIIGVGREVIGKRKDGTTFPMHLAVSEIKIGDRTLFNGIVRDISDLKAVEQKLAEMNEDLESRVQQRTAELREAQADLVRSEKFATLGKVSGGIAHEIRNPLNAVKTSAYYLLNSQNATEAKVREHLERIDRQVSLIDNVITALSDVAKLPDADLKRTDVSELLSSAVNSIGLPANIDVHIDVDPNLPPVLVDVNQIAIAFKNLIRNARDAMPDGGQISVRAVEENDMVSLHFEDTGVGIAPEDMERILEPLFTTKARGMGLGLSITRAIVEKNHGTLNVTSQLGEGSCFTIVLQKAAG